MSQADSRLTARAAITRLRASGYGDTAIAQQLNTDGIPTPSGRGQWSATTVYRHTRGREGWNKYMRVYREEQRWRDSSS